MCMYVCVYKINDNIWVNSSNSEFIILFPPTAKAAKLQEKAKAKKAKKSFVVVVVVADFGCTF